MKFAEHLSAHITPEWRKQYIQYEVMKQKIYEALEEAPSPDTTESRVVERYLAAFAEQFFHFCEKELAKINTFFSEKMAEATRKFGALQTELQIIKEADMLGPARSVKRLAKTASRNKKEPVRKLYDLKLAFSEFYLSLVLLQNYQSLNFTGFRKILKKHDKLLETESGGQWRAAEVETAPFYSSKEVDRIILETESLYTSELESGNRSKAMKRLRVPPLGQEKRHPWVTYRLGLFTGAFFILLVSVVFTGISSDNSSTTSQSGSRPDWLHVLRIYRGSLLAILACFLVGLNTYGWRTAGVNNVLIFELDPRDHLSHLQILEAASVLALSWAISLLCYQYHEFLHVPKFVPPLALVGFILLFLLNPVHVLYHKARFWLLRIIWRILTAPFHHVGFADFWLADQLNSLVTVFLDFEYTVCFYALEVDWHPSPVVSEPVCGTHNYGLRAVIACLPAWFRFAQCLRRYRDTKLLFPHVVNAGKYSTSFFVVIFSTLYQVQKAKSGEEGILHTSPFFYLWIISAVVSSCYTYTWDIKMDWGLMDKAAGENKLLREEIVYSSKAFYYLAMLEDLILRLTWTLTVSILDMGTLGLYTEVFKTVLAGLEVFRRFVWNFFRLENEHLNNCGQFRAVRDISVAPIDVNDQALLESMMDEDDGVTNRGKAAGYRKNRKQYSRIPDEVEEYEDENQATVSSLTEVLKARIRTRLQRKSKTPQAGESEMML